MRYCDGIGHIYCICCLANGKLYIGQTVKSIEKRFKEHKQAAKRGVPYRLYSAMRKYGVENFTIEEIIQVSAPNRQALKAKLCYIEERLIKRLQTKEFGYNSTDGGDGAVQQQVACLRPVHVECSLDTSVPQLEVDTGIDGLCSFPSQRRRSQLGRIETVVWGMVIFQIIEGGKVRQCSVGAYRFVTVLTP